MESFQQRSKGAWLPKEPKKVLTHVEQAQEFVAQMFVNHELKILTRTPNFSLQTKATWFGDTGLIYMDYGTHVQISPGPLEGFVLVQIPLSGHSSLRVEDQRIEASPNLATIPPGDAHSSMEWFPQSPHLCVYVKQERLDQVASELYGVDSYEGLRLRPSLDLTTTAGQRFKQAIVEFHQDVQGTDGLARLSRLSEESLIGRLLAASVNTLSESLDIPPSTPEPQTSQKRNLAHDYQDLVARHFHEDVVISDFAERLNISIRALQMAVAQEFDTTPSGLLQAYRLDKVRELLQTPSSRHLPIAQLAMACGFNHQGRFAAAYKNRFGETPRQTRASS